MISLRVHGGSCYASAVTLFHIANAAFIGSLIEQRFTLAVMYNTSIYCLNLHWLVGTWQIFLYFDMKCTLRNMGQCKLRYCVFQGQILLPELSSPWNVWRSRDIVIIYSSSLTTKRELTLNWDLWIGVHSCFIFSSFTVCW